MDSPSITGVGANVCDEVDEAEVEVNGTCEEVVLSADVELKYPEEL